MVSKLSTLSPSLMLDLMRFEQRWPGGDLEILAACIRHARRLLLHLQSSDRCVPLTVFPVITWCARFPPPIDGLGAGRAERAARRPAVMRPPGDRVEALVGEAQHYTAWARCCGSWRCAARATRCCPKSPGRPPTASRRG